MKKAILLLFGGLLAACQPNNNPPVDRDEDGYIGDTTIYEDGLGAPCDEEQIAYIADYDTPERLLNEGDDDEASSWLWFHEQYPAGRYLYFGDIHGEEDLASLHTLFWLRDIETDSVADVFRYSEAVEAATPYIRAWYRDGGNMILWGHAVVYAERLGRLPEGTYTAATHDLVCACGKGHVDMGHWLMSVQLFPGRKFKKDHSTHPLFAGLPIFDSNDLRGFNVKGPGWTEDHNCVFFNYPKEITGRSEQQEICYTLLTEYFGIWPLGVWDSQINWVSQLNVYELRRGQTDYRGRVLCIGNGGCEFSMKAYRQVGTDSIGNPLYETADERVACPTQNIYQANILRMAHNAIEYMRRENR